MHFHLLQGAHSTKLFSSELVEEIIPLFTIVKMIYCISRGNNTPIYNNYCATPIYNIVKMIYCISRIDKCNNELFMGL